MRVAIAGRVMRPTLCAGLLSALALVGCDQSGATQAVTQPIQMRRVELPGGLVVYPDAQRVEIAAITCLETGWLEQVACAPGTREHESLVAIEAKPSDVHAAMLLAGFQPGAPGRWTYEDQTIAAIPPRGDAVRISVRRPKEDGFVEEPIGAWMSDSHGKQTFPDVPWVFGGSLMAPNPPALGPGEHYVADYSGSIIGLVTFGDEVIGFSQVMADETEVQDPQWQVNEASVPRLGTKVTLVLTQFDSASQSAASRRDDAR